MKTIERFANRVAARAAVLTTALTTVLTRVLTRAFVPVLGVVMAAARAFVPVLGVVMAAVSVTLFTGASCNETDVNTSASSETVGRSPATMSLRPPAAEVAARQHRLVEAHPDGLIVFPGAAAEKSMEQYSWIQEPSFQYFSGLPNLPGAVLVIDAPRSRSILFAGGAPSAFGIPIDELNAQTHPGMVADAAVDSVVALSGFVDWMNNRLSNGAPAIYLDEPRRAKPTGAPDGMQPVQGFHALWRASLENTFEGLEIRNASQAVRELRWVKSEWEVDRLRRNAVLSALALKAGMRAVSQGTSQRQAEAAVVATCLTSGAEGPSFWPWMMSGPNTAITRVVRSFYDYHHLNRTMLAGELVRADVGCASGGYGGDVGRTVPVDGHFSDEQAAIWDLLVIGYLAGIDAMAPGVELDAVRDASAAAIARAGDSDAASTALAAAMANGVDWHIHGIGIESGETAGGRLEEGVVLAYEPMFVQGDEAYYLEDMILITATGHEVLTAGLPFMAQEMADFLSR